MSGNKVPWWKGAVFYAIYPLSFKDSNGDGIGDLGGIIEKLDYLNDGTPQSLGVDAIWLTPIFPSPNADYGYDVMDYCNIDPMFGNFAIFQRLLEEAHKRGMKVLLDFVPNHTSLAHQWFLESRFSRCSPKHDWYIWHNPVSFESASSIKWPPTNKKSVFGGSAWTFDSFCGQYYFHQFYREQPDLNWKNPQVQKAMAKILRFWLKKGIDGFRFDAVPHIRKEYFADDPSCGISLGEYFLDDEEMHEIFRGFRHVMDEFDSKVSIAEVYASPEELVKYYGKAHDEFHMAFNFSLLGLRKSDFNAKNTRRVVEKTEECFLPHDAWPNYALGNHDRSRIATRYGKKFAPLLAMLHLTLRGSPTIYYGEEIGMSDAFIPYDLRRDKIGRDKVRTPMQWDQSPYAGFSNTKPWLPVNPNFVDVNILKQRDDPYSLLSLYRELICLRKIHPAISQGTFCFLDTSNENCLVYVRELDGATYLITLNFSGEEERVEVPSIFSKGGFLLLSTQGDRIGWFHPKNLLIRPYEGCLARLMK